MQVASADDKPVPILLRLMTAIECAAVGAAATCLFLFPALAVRIWAWPITPFNSRYMGAIYFAALLPLVAFAVIARWSPGRIVVWMIFAFTTSIGVVMFFYIPVFVWTAPVAWLFWALYLVLPINSAIYLVKLRGWNVAGAQSTAARTRAVLLAVLVLFGLYGLGLLAVPEPLTSFWPWKVDAFHGRIYAASFLTPALGAWIVNRWSSAAERRLLGLTLVVLGVLAIAGTAWTSATLPPARQIDYAHLGPWAFFAINALSTGLGLGLLA